LVKWTFLDKSQIPKNLSGSENIKLTQFLVNTKFVIQNNKNLKFMVTLKVQAYAFAVNGDIQNASYCL
jgi:hypothetical protein